MSGTNLNDTWTEGNQAGISEQAFRRLGYRLSAGNADCGQYVAGADGPYRIGSVHFQTDAGQWPGVRHPVQFDFQHLLIGDLFRHCPIPPNADGVCFLDAH
jgi:hypothetical protein